MKRLLILVAGMVLALTSGFAAAALGALGTPCDPSNSSNVPIGNNDNYQTPVNTKLVVSAAQGMLANDLVCSKVSSTVVLASTVTGAPQNVIADTDILNGATPPSHGALITFSATPDGRFEYVPVPNFVGTDTFTYIIDDKNESTAPKSASQLTPTFRSGAITVTIQVTQPAAPIPTLSQWGLVGLLVLLGGIAALELRRRAAA